MKPCIEFAGKKLPGAEMTTSYRFPITVTDVFERKVQKHVSGAGDHAVFSSDSAGWYIRIENNLSIYVGMQKPDVAPGDKMVMKLERSQ